MLATFSVYVHRGSLSRVHAARSRGSSSLSYTPLCGGGFGAPTGMEKCRRPAGGWWPCHRRPVRALERRTDAYGLVGARTKGRGPPRGVQGASRARPGRAGRYEGQSTEMLTPGP